METRRKLLASIVTGTSIGVTGCLGSDEQEEDPEEEDSEGEDPEGEDPEEEDSEEEDSEGEDPEGEDPEEEDSEEEDCSNAINIFNVNYDEDEWESTAEVEAIFENTADSPVRYTITVTFLDRVSAPFDESVTGTIDAGQSDSVTITHGGSVDERDGENLAFDDISAESECVGEEELHQEEEPAEENDEEEDDDIDWNEMEESVKAGIKDAIQSWGENELHEGELFVTISANGSEISDVETVQITGKTTRDGLYYVDVYPLAFGQVVLVDLLFSEGFSESEIEQLTDGLILLDAGEWDTYPTYTMTADTEGAIQVLMEEKDFFEWADEVAETHS